MLQGKLPIISNNKDFSEEEISAISNVFRDKSHLEEEKIINIPNDREKRKNEISNKNELNRDNKLKINNKYNNHHYQDLIHNPNENTNNNYNSNTNLNAYDDKKLFENRNIIEYEGYINPHTIQMVNPNEQKRLNKIQKETKRVKFKNHFLHVVEIESYKSYNANMCYSDLQFVDTAERKSLCKELCLIL